MTEIAERPIIFGGEMVRAILADLKTQTRRVITPSWQRCLDLEEPEDVAKALAQCPHGRPGDRLWVRETWRFVGVDMNRLGRTHSVEDAVVEYADGSRRTITVDWQLAEQWMQRQPKRRPSIHMPRWASRLTLVIDQVRIERLQDILQSEAQAEGAQPLIAGAYREGFIAIWNGINLRRGYSWESNPWVWVIKFRRIEAAHD